MINISSYEMEQQYGYLLQLDNYYNKYLLNQTENIIMNFSEMDVDKSNKKFASETIKKIDRKSDCFDQEYQAIFIAAVIKKMAVDISNDKINTGKLSVEKIISQYNLSINEYMFCIGVYSVDKFPKRESGKAKRFY